MEKRPTNGRKKNVGQGSAGVNKREESAGAHGPVGKQNGYSAKQAAEQAAKEAREAAAQAQANGAGDADKGILDSLLGGMTGQTSGQSQSGSGLFNTGSAQQSQQGQQSTLGSLLGGFGSTTGGSGYSQQSSSSGGGQQRAKSPLMKLLLIVGVIIIGYILLKSCMGGGSACSLLPSGNTGSNIINDSGSSVDNGSLLQGLLSGTYDASDESAPMAQYASTSGSGYQQLQQNVTTTTPLTVDTTVSNKARAKYTTIRGNGQDTVTLMVYMCGTDLESKYGMATNDLNEMLHAGLNDDKVNIIVETGGTKTWKNNVISNSTNQRYRVTSKGMQVLNNNLGRRNMTDPATLTDFITYCKANYPADRYCLIFWDHGGGSLSGYGYDQYYSGSMTLDKINKALNDANVKFDFIGFDACLMATYENAVVIEKYADYLIASEETEPGCGWYYTNWLTALSRNTSMSTVDFAKIIIDDFNDVCRKNNCGDTTTLSITDLAEFAGTVPEAFNAFSTAVGNMLTGSEYQAVAKARSAAREYGAEAGINHCDLIHLAYGIAQQNVSGSSAAKNLIQALSGCIKYNRAAVAMKNSYGMSIYFPYRSFKSVNSAVALYKAIGVDSRYSEAIKNFASMAAGGQIATGQQSSPLGSLLGSYGGSTSTSSSDMLSQLLGGYASGGSSSGSSSSGGLLESLMGGDYSSWFNGRMVLDHSDFYDEHAITTNDMLLTDKAGGKVLTLTQTQWDMVESIYLNVFVDDGKGYIDLGMDNVYEFDDDGDLKVDFDGTWLTVNGQAVAFYVESSAEEDDGTWVTNGRIPAKLNGELVYLMVVFEYDPKTDTETDYIAGARYIYANGETDTVGKGLIEIKDGDKIDFICDYYTYDGSYVDTYLMGETLTVKGGLKVEYLTLKDVTCKVTYCLQDMYNNEFWTESIPYAA